MLVTMENYWPSPLQTISLLCIGKGRFPRMQVYDGKLKPGEIRLLKLSAGTEAAMLSCELRDLPLNSDVEYTALSYAWGTPSRTKYILCDGKLLRITQNLHSALHELQRLGSGEEALVWADAICINQNDKAEKTSQVRMMSEIYRRAHLVIAWLGEKNDSTDEGLNLLHSLGTLFGRLAQRGTLQSSIASQEHDLSAFGLPPANDSSWTSLSDICLRPWFSRIWPIQEYIVASQVFFLLGDIVIPSDDLLRTLWFVDLFAVLRTALVPPSQSEVHRADSLSSKYNINAAILFDLKCRIAKNKRPTLFELLNDAMDFSSYDARDRIFALLAISADFDESLIDYSKSLESLLVDITIIGLTAAHPKACDPCQQSISILCNATRATALPGLPSWVPNWTESQPRYPLRFVYPDADDFFADESDTRISEDLHLDLSAKLIDQIWTVVPSNNIVLPFHTTEREFLSAGPKIAAWDRKCLELVDQLETYPTGENLREVYWRTLVFNSTSEFDRAPPEFGDSYLAWRDIFNTPLPLHANTTSSSPAAVSDRRTQDPNPQVARKFNAVIEALVPGRSFCVTEAGYIGWVPSDSQPGDTICVFPGCRVPFVTSARSGKHLLLGDAYVHGMMDYEAWQRSDLALVPMTLH